MRGSTVLKKSDETVASNLTTIVHAYWHATSSDDSAEQFKEGCTCGFMPWEFRHYHAKYICMWIRA